MGLEVFEGHRYLNLETFRKNGRGVQTPVWFVREGEALYVWTEASSGKVKRLRHNPHVRIAPSDAQGTPLGPWQDAQAEILTQPEQVAQVERWMAAKYGLLFQGFRLLGKLRRSRHVALRISFPQEADAA